MADNGDLPIALRRTRRSTGGAAAAAVAVPAEEVIVAKTPNRRGRSKKQVRFSDPGPVLGHDDDDANNNNNEAGPSTGLTPMIRRTRLAGRSTPQRRRHSTPSSTPSAARRDEVSLLRQDMDAPLQPFSGAVTFLPLRQVLSGRVKRRLRRNGLSEEMNAIQAEKRQKAVEAKTELEQLRKQVAEKDAEIARLVQGGGEGNEGDGDVTVVQDTDRIRELENEVSSLRQRMASPLSTTTPEMERTCNWTLAARDPFASTIDIGIDDDDEMMMPSSPPGDVFGDTTMAELECSSTPRRKRDKGKGPMVGDGSFPTPPATSPTTFETPVTPVTPVTPSMFSRLWTPKTKPVQPAVLEVGVQASLPDEEKEMLQQELGSMRRETSKLTATLDRYKGVLDRLDEQLPGDQDDYDKLDERVALVLRDLSDKTAALGELSKDLFGLGFGDSNKEDGDNRNDPSEVVSNIAAALRTARLELEYLTPGEVALPLTSTGAAVLDRVLDQLRSLSRDLHAAEDQIDEYHALEGGLRRQLSSRVDAMDAMTRELQQQQEQLVQRDARIAALEVGTDRLKGAMAQYEREVQELEQLVERVEAEGKEAVREREEEVREKGEAIEQKDEAIRERDEAVKSKDEAVQERDVAVKEKDDSEKRLQSLSGQLAVALDVADRLRAELAVAAAARQDHGKALAQRDARMAALRADLVQADTALREAHETIRQLRVDCVGLETQLDQEKQRASKAVAGVQAALARVSREVAVWGGGEEEEEERGETRTETETEKTQKSSRSQKRTSNEERAPRKRRRYDSGLGFLDEDEELFF